MNRYRLHIPRISVQYTDIQIGDTVVLIKEHEDNDAVTSSLIGRTGIVRGINKNSFSLEFGGNLSIISAKEVWRKK